MSPVRVSTERLPISALSGAQWDEIWPFAERFTDTTREVFTASVREKQEILLIRDRATRALVGMATVDIYPVEFEGKRTLVIYAGNTLLDEGVRGASVLQRLGWETFLRTRLRNPLTPIHFFYDTYSYKSYLMPSRNFRRYWPRRDEATPPDVASFLNLLGARRYGSHWDAERGICRSTGAKKLKGWVAEVTEADLANPDIRFFTERNPGYREGDMLAVVAPLDAGNWIALARNLWRRSRRRPR